MPEIQRKFAKQRAAGDDTKVAADTSGIDRILEQSDHIDRLGCGRFITTVSSLPEIKSKLDKGWNILWCQLYKQTESKSGDIDE